jgi:hypothetical protein
MQPSKRNIEDLMFLDHTKLSDLKVAIAISYGGGAGSAAVVGTSESFFITVA